MDPMPTPTPLRPLVHFTPQRNWMNDPNGLVFHDGLWHLYFQYNPDGTDWGNMSWGHATSRDLQRWVEHPVAIRHRTGEQIFSGSVVVAGAPEGEHLVAYYTSAYDDGRQAQSSAISTDGGYTWTQDPANPILDRGTSSFRDPKIVRYAGRDGTPRWIMLAVEADERQVLFYGSEDLRSWEYLSTFGPLGDEEDVVWECPDLIALPLDDVADKLRWVLTLSINPVGGAQDADGSSMSYVVGRFDGVAFTPETDRLTRLDQGRDFYAGVTFDSAPGGAAIMLGWMGNWRYAAHVPTSPWRGAMSLPRVLRLRTVDGAPRLVQEPPDFIGEMLAGATRTQIDDRSAAAPGLRLSPHTLLELRWEPARIDALTIRIHGTDGWVDLELSPKTRTLRIARDGETMRAVHPDFASSTTGEVAAEGVARLLLCLDGPLLEVFVGEGEATASNLVLLGDDITASIHTEGPGGVSVTAVDLRKGAGR